jgi:hypothetical protein
MAGEYKPGGALEKAVSGAYIPRGKRVRRAVILAAAIVLVFLLLQASAVS